MKSFYTLILGLFLLSGCAATSSSPSSEAKAPQYLEIHQNGRIYVVGSEHLTEKYHPHLPYTQTFLGLGPKGETVVLELEKKGDELKNKLLGQVCDYFKLSAPACEGKSASDQAFIAIYNDGRYYVFGSEEMLQKYNAFLPLTQTYIGQGPQGETLIYEQEKKGTGLLVRLKGEFEAHHQSK